MDEVPPDPPLLTDAAGLTAAAVPTAVLAPILEDIAGWNRLRIRNFFESYGIMIQEWDRVRTDWLTLRPSTTAESEANSATAAK